MKCACFVFRIRLCLIALFCGACLLHASDSALPVTVTKVTRGAVDEVIEAPGSVTAERRSMLSARTSGLVSKIPVDAGSMVEEGAVLLELDSALARLALERARKALEEAQSLLLERKRLLDEAETLAQTGGIPKTEAEARRSALNVQAAALNQLEVDVREREEILDRHRVPAPFSGVINQKLTEVGEWVETGVPVVDLVEVNAVRFDAQLPQERFPSIPFDTRVQVRLDSMPEKKFPAEIQAKVPVKDPIARTFLVRLKVDAPADSLAPGVSGRAIFHIQRSAQALVLPRDALVRQPDGAMTAWVVEGPANGWTVSARTVKTGEIHSGTVEILEGLEEGQLVVLRGNETLRDGQRVRLLNPTASR